MTYSENRRTLEEQEKQYHELDNNQTTSAERLTDVSAELVEIEGMLSDFHMSSYEEEKRRRRADILSALQSVTHGVVRLLPSHSALILVQLSVCVKYGRVYELCEAKHHRLVNLCVWL